MKLEILAELYRPEVRHAEGGHFEFPKWSKYASKMLCRVKYAKNAKKFFFIFSRWPPIQDGRQGVSHLEKSKVSKLCLEMLKMSKNAKKKNFGFFPIWPPPLTYFRLSYQKKRYLCFVSYLKEGPCQK